MISEWGPGLSAGLILIAVGYLSLWLLRPQIWKGKKDAGTPGPTSPSKGSWKGWAEAVKRPNSYYYGHLRPSDGLDSSEYTMNIPKKLSSSASPSSRVTALPIGKPLQTYAFSDDADSADVYLEGDFTGISKTDVKVVLDSEDSDFDFRIEITSKSLGLRHLRIRRLFSKVTSAKVRKVTKKKIIVRLFKAEAGAWSRLNGA